MSARVATPVDQHQSPPTSPASPPHKRPKTNTVASLLNDTIENVSTPSPIPDGLSTSAALASATAGAYLTTMASDLPQESKVVVASDPPLNVQLLSANAKAPTRGSAFAAGYDLYASKAAIIPARGRGLVDTDISIAVPEGTYGRVAPRSGLAVKHGIDTGAGVIDADYRGPVKVVLFNTSDKDFAIVQGDRIAQLIIERIFTPDVVVVETLPESVRGAGGFGSTGGFGTTLPPINAS